MYFCVFTYGINKQSQSVLFPDQILAFYYFFVCRWGHCPYGQKNSKDYSLLEIVYCGYHDSDKL